MKQSDAVTKKDLSEAIDSVLQGIDNIVENMATKTDLKKVEARLEEKIDNGVNTLSTEISFIKDDIKGFHAELSNTVSRKEFEELKERVDEIVLN